MWTSLAATVLLAGGAIGSRGRYAIWSNTRGFALGVHGGAFCGGYVPGPSDRWSLGSVDPNYPKLPGWFWYSDADSWNFRISLWLPAGATFALSSLSAFMVYRRRLPGHCPCGYDRSGLPPGGPCPECGRAGA